MTTRPINLKDWQVRAALEDRLELIVVPLKVQPEFSDGVAGGVTTPSPVSVAIYPDVLGGVGGHYQPSPFYSGDLLWCREVWAENMDDHYNKVLRYRADDEFPTRWRSPVTMPRWASRATLRVESVTVKRVQEITEDEVRLTGVLDQVNAHCGPMINCYGPECPTDLVRSCNTHGCWGIREDFAKNFPAFDTNPWCAFARVEVISKNVEDLG